MSSPKLASPVIYTRVIPGENLVMRGVYVYECPLCRKRFRYDDPYEPACSGPSESRDEHPLEVMRLVAKVPMKISIQGIPAILEK